MRASSGEVYFVYFNWVVTPRSKRELLEPNNISSIYYSLINLWSFFFLILKSFKRKNISILKVLESDMDKNLKQDREATGRINSISDRICEAAICARLLSAVHKR